MIHGETHFFLFRTNLNYLPAVKIAGAYDDSSTDETERWVEQRLPGLLPALDSEVKTMEGVEEVGEQQVSGRVIIQGEVAPPGSSANPSDLGATHEASPHVVHTSGESSSSESSEDDDDEDFLDLLVDSFDGDFDPELFI